MSEQFKGFTPEEIQIEKQGDLETLLILSAQLERKPMDSFEKEFKKQGTIFNARVRAIQLQSEISNLDVKK